MKKILFCLFLIPALIFGQELDATVTVNYEQLPNASKDKLQYFGQQVEDYLNNSRFTSTEWEGEKIKCSFSIFFNAASGETNYSAQLVVSSQRPIEGTQKNSLMLSILDNTWRFKYEKNQAMYFNQTDFDPLTSFLDFYAYIIIGFDMDSYYPLGGSDSFSKAYDITLLGANSGFADGWGLKSSAYNRRALVDDLLNVNFNQFRQDYFNYHYWGIDIYTQDKEKAQQNLINLVMNLDETKEKLNRRSVLLKVFFDAKNGEIINYLKDTNKEIFEALKRVDPAHTSKYNEVIESM